MNVISHNEIKHKNFFFHKFLFNENKFPDCYDSCNAENLNVSVFFFLTLTLSSEIYNICICLSGYLLNNFIEIFSLLTFKSLLKN